VVFPRGPLFLPSLATSSATLIAFFVAEEEEEEEKAYVEGGRL
jgi:hypothetical protein